MKALKIKTSCYLSLNVIPNKKRVKQNHVQIQAEAAHNKLNNLLKLLKMNH